MCILVSASDHATAAPEAPAPMMRTSTGLFILVLPNQSSLRGAKRRSNPCRHKRKDGLLRFARNDEYSIHDPHRQRADAADEIRIEPLYRPGDLEAQIARQNLLEQDTQLLLGEPVADAAMDAGAEGE